MRIFKSRVNGQRGSTLFIALVITGLVGLSLAAYLSLLQVQSGNNYRSQAWNSAMPVIEAGIEDALGHLNAHGYSNLLCDGWAQAGSVYWARRSIGGNTYLVTISNWVAGISNLAPVIESRGYVTAPLVLASATTPLLADAARSSSPAPAQLGRGVRAVALKISLLSKGLVAKGQIDLKGNTIATDSFDSTDPNYSTNGHYDPTKDKANGDVATNSGLTNSLAAGNANIMGHLSTGPGGSASVGPNGTVGDKAWVNAGNKGIEAGHSTDDMNINFFDVPTPTGSFFTPVSGLVGLTPFRYLIASSGSYKLDTLNLSGSDVLRITGGATVTLYVPGNVSMSGQSAIQIDPGATLKLYVGGASASIGGQGVLNSNANAQAFYYFGLPSNTSLSLSGNAAFTGVIYAPSADFTLGGGGNNTVDFIGASVTSTVTMNGHFNFHYDENLAKSGPAKGFVVTSWNEMTPQEVAAIPSGVNSQVSQ